MNPSSQQYLAAQTGALTSEREAWLKSFIRSLPDFPQPGILFRDITPLLQNTDTLRFTLEAIAARYRNAGIQRVVGIESRGFIFGVPIAYLLGVGFAPVRKQGKLPAETMSIEYSLEYGSSALEIHKDALNLGERALIVDDLLATGGTAAATRQLVERLGGVVVSLAFVIELTGLKGRERLPGIDVFSLLSY
jgi:adenine phosphoribosyltransferase